MFRFSFKILRSLKIFTFQPKFFLRQNDLRLKTRPIIQEIETFLKISKFFIFLLNIDSPFISKLDFIDEGAGLLIKLETAFEKLKEFENRIDFMEIQ